MIVALLLCVAFGYGLGSIPFGLVLARIAGYGDIRKIGSGNIGATNVLRTGNKLLAFLTVLCDGGKGAAAVGLAMLLFPSLYGAMLAAGFFAVIGHMYPVWLGFKGGKAVATMLGTIMALSPILGITLCGIWLVMAFAFRISSLSGLTASALAPVLAYLWLQNEPLAFIAAGIAVLIFLKHKANIQRLLKGEEPKIGKGKKK